MNCDKVVRMEAQQRRIPMKGEYFGLDFSQLRYRYLRESISNFHFNMAF